ncbi:MAG: TIGR00270 family protein [Candidatus Korarchaeota archaeon]|nr:TIGR00270 family protein [Candidatus Korarchaeota archaeon]NIU84150.1 TIGR00270 family protein [Candidatus Thorarchaeota archaeon]NIW14295.1 TIGR00270 family protein [Candidatus Thorarchaeota archaeon]NIW52392.1 TIGR00270 family protein [Candidatus Korarchaeota archaeon]
MQRSGVEITCEICGRNVSSPSYYRVDGRKMILCKVCAKRGGFQKVKTKQRKKEVPRSTSSQMKTKSQKVTKKRRHRRYTQERKHPVRNVGKKIRAARLHANLTKKELARTIKEKVSYLSKIEKGEMTPSMDVIAKIEGHLGINLTETPKAEVSKTSWGKEEELTVGDVVQIRGKKKENQQ